MHPQMALQLVFTVKLFVAPSAHELPRRRRVHALHVLAQCRPGLEHLLAERAGQFRSSSRRSLRRSLEVSA